MVEVSPVTLADWQEYGEPPATEADVAEVRRLAGAPLPDDYLDFLSRYGFASWDDALPAWFSYAVRQGDAVVEQTSALTHLQSPSSIASLLQHAWSDDPASGFPVAPSTMFPFAGTAGQDLILLNLAPERGIWFLPEGREDPWGTGDNTQLGYIAPDFTTFIDGLRADA